MRKSQEESGPIKCGLCGGTARAIHSQEDEDTLLLGAQVRRRECKACGHRWTATEFVGTPREVLRRLADTHSG